MTDIWAKNLLRGEYEYVLVYDADEEILSAISELSSESSMPESKDGFVLQVVPSDDQSGISLLK